MKKILTIYLLSVFFFNCKTGKTTDNTVIQKNDWIVSSLQDFSKENDVRISIVNNRSKDLFIFDPFLKKIEYFDGKKWNKLSLPYCPCGGCPNPPENFTISSNNKHTFSWDKNLISCENEKKQVVKAKTGRYRITFNYTKSKNQREFEKLVVEFKI